MIKAIESELYRISKDKNYDDMAYNIEIKGTSNYIIVFKEELDELIELLSKTKEVF